MHVKKYKLIGWVMPEANPPWIVDGALASGVTHPTGVASLKCCKKIVGWVEALRNPTS